MSHIEFEEEEFTSQVNGKTLGRILQLVKRFCPRLVVLLVGIAVTASLDGYFTYLNKRIVDEGILAGDSAMVVRLVTIYGSLILFQAAAVFVFIYLTGTMGQRVQYDLRQRMFNHLQELSFSYFDRTPVGWIMARVTSDSERIAELVTWGIVDTSWGTVSIITSVYFMMRINWQLGLIVFASIPILLAVAVYFRKKIIVEFRKARKINSKITGAYNENITGVRVVKALGREEQNLTEFSGLTGQMYRASYRAAWLSALFLPTVQLIGALATGVIVWYGGFQTRIGVMTIGGIQAFVSYVAFMMWPIQDLAHIYAEM